MLGAKRWRSEADPERVPPGAGPRLEDLFGRAPADEVVGAGQEDLAVCASELCRGPVEEHPPASDAIRQERRVLVFRVPHDPVALDRLKSSVVARKTAGPVGP